MKKSKVCGNEKTGNIAIFEEKLFPKISHLTGKMSDTERRVLSILIVKEPGESWEKTAKKIGVTTRQLFNIRHKETVREARYIVSKELFRADLPDILKVLSRKAIDGQPWAVKLALELSGELDGQFNGSTDTVFNLISSMPRPKWNKRLTEGDEEPIDEKEQKVILNP